VARKLSLAYTANPGLLLVRCYQRGWSLKELARQAGVSHSVTKLAARGGIPTYRSQLAIAAALDGVPGDFWPVCDEAA
jgi:lambda repressor-like predicted transcriptional regulator